MQIFNNIPVPEKKPAGGRPVATYAFADMAVGDSFFVAVTDSDAKKVVNRLSGAARNWRNKSDATTGHKFRVIEHAHPETGAPAVGVWRVA